VKVGNLHIAADQALFMGMDGRIRDLYNLDVKTVGFHQTLGQRVIGTVHAEAISVVSKGQMHRCLLKTAKSLFSACCKY
ncbi:MAG: hypothetical protein O6918_00320, partial [Deltaproteobacteria bacterium]|nr:hypothetical protein [Deltaproteobacteria bacterium]